MTTRASRVSAGATRMPDCEGLFALRVSAGRHEVRIFYAFFPGQRIVLLHGFLKKTRTIPTRELEIARARLRELQES